MPIRIVLRSCSTSVAQVAGTQQHGCDSIELRGGLATVAFMAMWPTSIILPTFWLAGVTAAAIHRHLEEQTARLLLHSKIYPPQDRRSAGAERWARA